MNSYMKLKGKNHSYVFNLFGCTDRREVPSDYFNHSILGISKVSSSVKIQVCNQHSLLIKINVN